MSANSKTANAAVTAESPVKHSLGDLPQAWGLFVPSLLLPAYLSFIPIVEYIARFGKVTPFLNTIMYPVLWGLSGFDANFSHVESLENPVVTISLFYAIAVWIGSTVLSLQGQTLGRHEGYQNRSPRLAKASLTGYPHRLTALHQNLLEVFPLFAIAAVLTQIVDPSNPHLIELLGLHVVSKALLYVPFYAADLDVLRSLSHFVGIGACIRVLSVLALKQKL